MKVALLVVARLPDNLTPGSFMRCVQEGMMHAPLNLGQTKTEVSILWSEPDRYHALKDER